MMHVASTASLFVILSSIEGVMSTITTNSVGDYTCVYDDSNTYTWYDAQQYCSDQGVSLGSIHSDDDQVDYSDSLIIDDWTWIGLQDIDDEAFFDGTLAAPWVWDDGTSWDYVIDWYNIDPDGGEVQDCVFGNYEVGDDKGFIDANCDTSYGRVRQFICNNFEDPDQPDCTLTGLVEVTDGSISRCDSNCQVCNNEICSQCVSGTFKKANDYLCVDCTSVFGDGCMFCQDYNGCGQCVTNTYQRVYDSDCELWKCEETPCADASTFCSVCNNGECSQCNGGYVLKETPGTQCHHCQDTFGSKCMHCSNFIGCQQCSTGSTRYQAGDNLYYCTD